MTTSYLKPYDNYEIHGCAECTNEGETESFIEQCPDGEADFWTLYGHLPEGGVQAIGDFATREEAEATFQRITGIPFGGHEELAARVRLMQAAPKLLAACQGILASFHESVTTKESLAGFPALAAVAEAVAEARSGTATPPPPIVIEVRDGCVVNVTGLPPGYLYDLQDHDPK